MTNTSPTNVVIHSILASRRQIAIIWCIDDVREVRPDLNEEQCWDVLQHVKSDHDAGIGINWEVLGCVADMLFDDAPNEEAE